MNFSVSTQSAFKGLVWSLEHLLFPAIIVFLGIIVNNYCQEKKQPNLIAYPTSHKVTKISDNKYKFECPFIISNDGGSTTKSQMVAIKIIPENVLINEIKMPNEYRGFCDKKGGGIGYDYVAYSLNIPKEKSIKGIIIFYNNVEIPEESMNPIKFMY